MRLTAYQSAGAFVRANLAYLERQEVVNGLLLGLALGLQDEPLRYGGPVSMAAGTRPIVHGITVNRVYTSPALRRRGYATACVAALSQRLLDEGYQFSMLFTDLANPTSNNIYQQIGYRPVCDFRETRFERV